MKSLQLAETISSVVQHPRIGWASREIPMSYGRHTCGRHVWGPSMQSVPFESLCERDVIAFLTQQNGFSAVFSQPFTLDWRVGLRRYRYTPDLLVVFNRTPRKLQAIGFGRWTVVEVKPWALLAEVEQDVRCRLSMVTATLGFNAVVMTERDVAWGSV